MRILVAEDDRITRANLSRQLKLWGHEIVAAEDGQSAWELYESGTFDIVLTDWEMPRMSGLELIQHIRKLNRRGYVYVLMLTSRSEKTDLVAGIEAGADDFVSKPFDREELRVRLLAGERVVTLEQALLRQNEQLQEANDRIRRDLDAAARVQRAMLPKSNIETPSARTAWVYVPTDELAGDAIGLHLIEDRYLVSYVVDVSGHGVPAALLSVTAMHYLEPVPEATSFLRDPGGQGGLGSVRRPAQVVGELNRRFSSDNSDNRFLTMILTVLDTQTGQLHVCAAGHPMPIILRRGEVVPVNAAGGMPIAIFNEAEYDETLVELQPGDRFVLFSDGMVEQANAGGDEFGEDRLVEKIKSLAGGKIQSVTGACIDSLAVWAGGRNFTDDVSLVMVEYGPPVVG
jgi:sigma-B regulation protein RsbU (phosphoserine phosphatase)